MLESDLTVATLFQHYADVRKRLMVGRPKTKKPVEKVLEPEIEIELPPPPLLAPPVVKTQYPSIDMILVEVVSFYNVCKVDLISTRRSWDIILPRHVAIYLCRKLTPHSLPTIGRRFGGRDHTTILHACNKIAGKAEIDAELAQDIATIRSRIEQRHAEQNRLAA